MCPVLVISRSSDSLTSDTWRSSLPSQRYRHEPIFPQVALYDLMFELVLLYNLTSFYFFINWHSFGIILYFSEIKRYRERLTYDHRKSKKML